MAPDYAPRYLNAISQAEFVSCRRHVFRRAILVYTHSQKWLLPVMLMTWSAIGFAVARVMYVPDSFSLAPGSRNFVSHDRRGRGSAPGSLSLGALGNCSLVAQH